MKAKTIKRNAFQLDCYLTKKKHVFKTDLPGDWVLNINKMIEVTKK